MYAFSPIVISIYTATSILVGVIILAWLKRYPVINIYSICIALVAGQLIRVPLFGQGGGLLVSDIAVTLLCSIAFIIYVQHGEVPIKECLINSISLFIAWALFTLVVGSDALNLSQLIVSGAYWVRLTVYLLALPALIFMKKQIRNDTYLLTGFVITIVALCFFGLIQLLVFPVLTTLVSRGWDPHHWRMVSTWLDPNFLGGLFAITIPYLVMTYTQKKYMWIPLLVLLSLVLTQSRSSFIALILASLCMIPFWWRHYKPRSLTSLMQVKIGAIIGLLISSGLISAFLLQERLWQILSADPTITLRLQSLKIVWEAIIQPHWLLGVGYNAYQYIALQVGLIGDFMIHSRAGADSSIFTLWATTGIIGVLLWLLPWSYVTHNLWKQQRPQATAVMHGLVVWAIHGQMVNSWLYSHILLAVIILVVLEYKD